MAEMTREEIEKIVDAELERRRETRGLPARWKLEALAWMGGVVIGLAAIAAVGLSSWVASIVRAKAEEIVTDDRGSGFQALRDTVVEAIANQPGFERAVAIHVLPEGAVLAVDNPNGCPRGWVQEASTNGRFIVGVGGQVGGSARVFRESGGAETHTLTMAEMPRHDHGGRTDSETRPVWSPSKNQYAVPTDPGGKHITFQDPHQHGIAPAGEDQPHNNMPPYIALYFCKKEAG